MNDKKIQKQKSCFNNNYGEELKKKRSRGGKIGGRNNQLRIKLEKQLQEKK